MPLTASGTLQAATAIAKTTPTIMGAEIACGGYDYITLFYTYTKGDETGVYIYPYFRWAASGTNYPMQLWSETAGVYTAEQVKYTHTATAVMEVTIDIRGVEFIAFYQGGSNNDGTPTGTLAAYWSMTK
jgi:hypothetical protein